MIIDPTDMNLNSWTDQMTYLVDKETPVMRADGNWREWATNLMNTPNFRGQSIPDPASFSDWREWGERFFETVELDG